MLAVIHGVHPRLAVSLPCTPGVSAIRNGHGCGSPSKSLLRALGNSALVVPRPFLLALLFPGKALLCRERCSGHSAQCLKQRKPSWSSLDSLGVQKVLCLPGGEIKPVSHHILKQAGAGTLLGRHGVGAPQPLQMGQMLLPFPCRRA